MMKLYGKTVQQMLVDDESPSVATTAAGRELEANVTRANETSHTKTYRLNRVLNEYPSFVEAFRLDLANAAIMWSFAILANHQRADECGSNFHAVVDIMYAGSCDAENRLSESQREQIQVAAAAVQEHLIPSINAIVRESLSTLNTYPEGGMSRSLAEWLFLIRTKCFEHTSETNLCELIIACVKMVLAISASSIGAGNLEDELQSRAEVAQACAAIVESMKD